MSSARPKLTFAGHSTVAIEVGGARLLTDPLLRQRVGHLRRAAQRLELDAWAATDVVLLSHAHHDHLDLRSLRKLDRAATLVVAPGVGRIVGKLGFADVIELTTGESTAVAGVEITATHAEHRGGRLFGSSPDTVGFVIAAGGLRIYFAGDTDLFGAMADLAPLDLALLPVWGWGARVGSGHLDPDSAAEALELLQPKVAIPIHWGTLYPIGSNRSGSLPLKDPPHRFARAAANRAPDVEVRILQPGESTSL